MKLSQAATYFHTTPFSDAYNPATQFNGRLLPYDDNSRDSLSTDRRIMAVADSVTIPARRVVKVGNQCWIVGQGAVDYHGAEALRHKFILHRADELATVKTFGQALRGDAGQSIWAGRLWVKELKEPTESSGMYDNYQLFFAGTEDIRDPAWSAEVFTDGREENVLVMVAGRWHLVRATMDTAGGLLTALVDELPEPVLLDVEYSTSVYNRLLDKKVMTPSTIPAINLRWQTNFTYLAAYAEKYKPGDSQLLVLKTAVTPTAGDAVTVRGRLYRVVSVIDQNEVWSLHLRHD